jgi:transposase
MAKAVLDEGLWRLIKPLLPEPKRRRRRHPGRRPLGNRAALTGILFVLKTGIPWEYLPAEMGCGSGMTCWRRLRDWQRRGVWDRIHRVLLAKLRRADKIDWSRAVADSTSVRAVSGGRRPGPAPRIAARTGANTTCSPTSAASRFACG